MNTYDLNRTTGRQAAVRCGLRIKRSGDSLTAVALVDEKTGEVVFEGQRQPDSWDFMRNKRGLSHGAH